MSRRRAPGTLLGLLGGAARERAGGAAGGAAGAPGGAARGSLPGALASRRGADCAPLGGGRWGDGPGAPGWGGGAPLGARGLASGGAGGEGEAGGGGGGGGAGAPPALPLALRLTPPAAHPYVRLMRADKPIGTWLLAWPGMWAIALAGEAGAAPDWGLMALFGAGAFLLRGAGCTVNDLWDRELDRAVERTRGRPLAAGEVTPLQATAFLGAQLGAGLGVLLQLNPYSQALGAASLALVGAYPAMKRVTWWPQAFLGLTINWGVLLGWAAESGAVDWAAAAPLYLGAACWTLVYDTIYAHQDKRDDAAAGIKSTALRLGDATKPWLWGFAALHAAGMAACGAAAGAGPLYALGAAGASAHVAWQIRTVDLDDGADCMSKFVSNRVTGGIFFAGILGDKVLGAALPL